MDGTKIFDTHIKTSNSSKKPTVGTSKLLSSGEGTANNRCDFSSQPVTESHTP